jgi:hypothetical protein
MNTARDNLAGLPARFSSLRSELASGLSINPNTGRQTMPAKTTKTAAATVAGKPLIDAIHDRGARSMEQVIDRRFGLIFERWLLPNGTGLVSLLAPEYREVFDDADGSTRPATPEEFSRAADVFREYVELNKPRCLTIVHILPTAKEVGD